MRTSQEIEDMRNQFIADNLETVKVCSGDIRYLLTLAVKTRIRSLVASRERECYYHNGGLSRDPGSVDYVNDILSKIDVQGNLIPLSHSKQIHADALRAKGVSQPVIDGLSGEAIQELARVFCDVTCDKPYTVSELVDMV